MRWVGTFNYAWTGLARGQLSDKANTLVVSVTGLVLTVLILPARPHKGQILKTPIQSGSILKIVL